ncbi:hypothetical protein [Halovivax cerinus]|uniref:Uncharacterized protein n=1 Tax=Halovivax cerinus TaxID=1487865 RepID=A0ABD5NSI8_9EURY|nr:hypothetical protein [Halovivax cerinus]
MCHAESSVAALLVAVAAGSLVGVTTTKSTLLWLGWAVATVVAAGAVLLWSNWGHEPQID